MTDNLIQSLEELRLRFHKKLCTKNGQYFCEREVAKHIKAGKSDKYIQLSLRRRAWYKEKIWGRYVLPFIRAIKS